MDLDSFAEYFITHLPISALVYDNRSFGSSDGLPRCEIIPSLQVSDMQDAITYAQTLEEIDSERIAIWGSSYSGANVLQVAALDRRVKAVLAQVPMISGWENANRLISSVAIPEIQKICVAGYIIHNFRLIILDRINRMKGGKPATVPVVTNDPHGMAALPGIGAWEYFETAHLTKAPNWVNEVTIKRFCTHPSTKLTFSLEVLPSHNPRPYIPLIAPTPLLLTVAANDTITPTDLQLAAYNEAREPKQLELVPGDHFVVYAGPTFEKVVSTQTEFLRKWLIR